MATFRKLLGLATLALMICTVHVSTTRIKGTVMEPSLRHVIEGQGLLETGMVATTRAFHRHLLHHGAGNGVDSALPSTVNKPKITQPKPAKPAVVSSEKQAAQTPDKP